MALTRLLLWLTTGDDGSDGDIFNNSDSVNGKENSK